MPKTAERGIGRVHFFVRQITLNASPYLITYKLINAALSLKKRVHGSSMGNLDAVNIYTVQFFFPGSAFHRFVNVLADEH